MYEAAYHKKHIQGHRFTIKIVYKAQACHHKKRMQKWGFDKMETAEAKQGTVRHSRKTLTLTQNILIFILIILVIFMMFEINSLQGTARVINYAGLVRGATQRLVKLEMTQNPNDELIAYLDDILSGLKYEEGSYRLTSLDDVLYQENLDELMLYWGSLKEQIQAVRESSYETKSMDRLLEMSEVYFQLADQTVSSAEVYSEKVADDIQVIEIISALDMSILFFILMEQTFSSMKMRKENAVLAKKAYIDTHTGLQNKNMCEELLNNKQTITEPLACIVFDINNLKHTNDTYGHLAGDTLIADFAKALRSVVRKGDFAGRYGGDEFMLILYSIEENTVHDVLKRLEEAVNICNQTRTTIPISYAYGWALSANYEKCTFKTLFSDADRCMYHNKQEMKRRKRE